MRAFVVSFPFSSLCRVLTVYCVPIAHDVAIKLYCFIGPHSSLLVILPGARLVESGLAIWSVRHCPRRKESSERMRENERERKGRARASNNQHPIIFQKGSYAFFLWELPPVILQRGH